MKKLNIDKWKEILKDYQTVFLEQALKIVLEKIKLLESIYQVQGENYYYSEEFNDQAYIERQALCQYSSALFSMLRERNVDVDKFYIHLKP